MTDRYDDLVEQLELTAQHLDIEGDNRSYSYNKAAKRIRRTTFIPPDPSDLDGIGSALREPIEEWRATGTMDILERMEEKRPWLTELSSVEGIGPKRARKLAHDGITSKDELRQAADSSSLTDVHGIGTKTAEKIERNL